MSLQPQIIILLPIIQTELQLIKIEHKCMEFINNLDLLKNILILQDLEGLYVKLLQQNQACHFKHKAQELTERLKKEGLTKTTFMTNYFSLETNEYKVMKSL